MNFPQLVGIIGCQAIDAARRTGGIVSGGAREIEVQ